ncbi:MULTISPECIES: carboxymuconolactone decarboxylase family protein [Sinorhizobium]|uniref:carboxymuconolactone decarboxylase family protein n=1 Tax=Sinorhizobium TaxID=28105 RepID=UPI0024B073C7|nr:carboxymuconolactone decarboxylase family protein [Sinorhizobium terangae]WFU51809.1 carboxymuconolactone decarboxylase family protein [Sinorhizobium terangae]
MTTRCDDCIAVHAKKAVELGALHNEIAEALGVLIALNAGAALSLYGAFRRRVGPTEGVIPTPVRRALSRTRPLRWSRTVTPALRTGWQIFYTDCQFIERRQISDALCSDHRRL